MPPKVLQKNNNDRAGGVLPIPASARVPAPPKQPAAKLKLEIRRLPPGLTLAEFEHILGDEWKLGGGKVDWREYRHGKLKSPGKLPEQSRCYVHVVKEHMIKDFEQRFLAVVFHDKAGTHKHAELRGLPPTLGFAPNQRIPALGKQRQDNRQGTIDQDAEFIAFLEAETQPVPKPAAIDVPIAEKEAAVKKSTPLIEDLRERKANKAKAAAAKAEKKGHGRAESKDVAAAETKAPPPPAPAGKKGDKAKTEQAAKDAAKVLNKQASGKQAQNAAAAAANASATTASATQKGTASPAKGRRGAPQQSPKPAAAAAPAAPASPAPQRGPPQRQRGNAEGIKKMLQKDLGIKPKATPANQTLTAAAAPANTPTPRVTLNAPAASKSQPRSSTPATQSTAPATFPKAYLKHANPSQGMTEMLIQRALAVFGEMGNVTIDPRKGTAIAVFKTQEGLKKAIEAKKVQVANGAVEVMEFKDRGGPVGGGGNVGGGGSGGGGGRGGGMRGGRAGGRGGRGGGNASASAASAASAQAAKNAASGGTGGAAAAT